MANLTRVQSFPAQESEVANMTAFVTEIARAVGFPEKRVMQCQLAVEEVALYVCKYAYAEPPQEVRIRAQGRESWLTIELSDDGVPFDTSADDPDALPGLQERKEGWLNVFVLQSVVNEMNFRRDGTTNFFTLSFKLDQSV